MPQISINRSEIPLWTGGEGKLNLKADVPNLNAPLTPGPNPIAAASFECDGSRRALLGGSGSLTLGVNAGATLLLAPLWQGATEAAPKLVEEYGLAPLLSADNVLLALQAGASTDVTAEASFRFLALSPGASLEAGADAMLTYVRPFDRSTPFLKLIRDFLAGVQLPTSVTAPPAPGEVIALEYGGYLGFGVSASAGYEIKGTNSFAVRDLELSEHWQLGVVGKVELTGKIAGRFRIEVREGRAPGWARVTVRRTRSNEIRCAADVNVGAQIKPDGLPKTGKEFVGALLGVTGKNWLNVIETAVSAAGKLPSLDALKAGMDSLGRDFFARYCGKRLEDLTKTEAAAAADRLNRVVQSYRNLDQSAIALFDRYFDPILDQTPVLEQHLNELEQLTSWDQLKGEISPSLWNVVRQLTNGDPLNWALGAIPGKAAPSLPELKKRIADAKALIRDKAHQDVRDYLKLAKSEFGLDHFFDTLAKCDTPDDLKQVAQQVKHFVSRLVGRDLDGLNATDLKQVFSIVQKVIAAREQFWETFEQKIKKAASQRAQLDLHAEYSRLDERGALIDVDIRLVDEQGTPNAAGQRLMKSATHGDFSAALASYQPDVVRLREAVLTHKLTRAGLVRINIAGWHDHFTYQELHRVLTSSEQQIRTSDTGQITVFTTVDLAADSDKSKRGTRIEETMHTNFVLRFLGETCDTLSDSSFNRPDHEYAIEVITGRTATYSVNFTDSNTSRAELDEYLAFADYLGLSSQGATANALAPLLGFRNGTYGAVSGEYAVRFSEPGLARLFRSRIADADIRRVLRAIVLANYIKHPVLGDAAWLYASDEVRKCWEDSGPNFVNAGSLLDAVLVKGFKVVSPVPGVPATVRVGNSVPVRSLLHTLFLIEDDVIKGFQQLQKLIGSGARIPLKEFEKRMDTFGRALSRFDAFDEGENSIFAVFDGLIRLQSPALEARSSSMSLTFERDGEKHTAMFVLEAQEARAAG